MLQFLNALEQKIVSKIVPSGANSVAHSLAINITRLGNFWLYPIIGLMLLATKGTASLPVIAIGSANIFFLHRIYPFLKDKCARQRPTIPNNFEKKNINPLDIYSFPSGHVMTLTGLVVPIMMGFPDTVWLGVAAVFIMAWARIACSHHYPTDIIGGVTLGLAISYPFTVLLLAR